MIKTLVVFAHPDDEVLWAGGFLIRYRKVMQVDFVRLTLPFNIHRISGLMKLDRYFNVSKVMCLGFEDDPDVYRKGKPFSFYEGWVDAIDFKKYHIILSHNENGEYGHPHHIFVHNTLKRRSIPFISFGHKEGEDFGIILTPREVRLKQRILEDLYTEEVKRCLTKFSYWNTPVERYKFEGKFEKNSLWENLFLKKSVLFVEGRDLFEKRLPPPKTFFAGGTSFEKERSPRIPPSRKLSSYPS